MLNCCQAECNYTKAILKLGEKSTINFTECAKRLNHTARIV